MFPQTGDSKLPSELMLTFLDMMERPTSAGAQQSRKDHLTLDGSQTLLNGQETTNIVTSMETKNIIT